MALNFDIAPYYDDFSENKNFYKILFQPSRPVQTRELNQLQSILQDQVKKFGNHVFKNGTVVIPGHIYYDNKVKYIKLEAIHNSVSTDIVINNLVGKRITNTSDVEALVIHAEPSTDTDPPTLIVKYTAGSGEFSVTDILRDAETEVEVARVVNTNATGNSSIVTINEGVYYINGIFVGVNKQTIILDKYDNKPTFLIGLEIIETIVTTNNDESLYDNALGYPNYAAPGADRYKISLILTKLDYSSSDFDQADISFIKLLKINEGIITYEMNDTAYAEVERYLARRTMDESGNYLLSKLAVEPFNYRSNNRDSWIASTPYLVGDVVRDSEGNYWMATSTGISGVTEPSNTNYTVWEYTDGSVVWSFLSNPIFNNGIYRAKNTASLDNMLFDDAQMIYKVSPGAGYINGYKFSKKDYTLAATSKSTEFEYKDNEIVAINSGSFIEINDVQGIPNIDTYETVNLYYTSKTESASWAAYYKKQAVAHIDIVAGIPTPASISITDNGFGYDRDIQPIINIGTEWAVGQSITAGEQRWYGNNLYTAGNSATTLGAVPPTHTNPATPLYDGGTTLGVQWDWVGTRATFKAKVGLTGQLESITVVSPGSGYINDSDVALTISAPSATPPVIGTARIRSFEFKEGTIGAATCKYIIQVFDVNLKSGYDFSSHVFSISNASASFSSNLVKRSIKLSGSVSYTSSSKEVDGVGTEFMSQLAVGDMIRVGDEAGVAGLNYFYNRVTNDQFSDVVIGTTHGFTTNLTNVPMYLIKNTFVSSGALFQPLPKMFVRSIRSNDDTTNNVSYVAVRRLTLTVAASTASASLSVPGETFSNPTLPSNYLIADQNTKEILPLTAYTVTRPTNTSISISFTSLPAGSVELICKINKTGVAAREKIRILKTTHIDLTTVAKLQSANITLGKSDVYRIVKILKTKDAGTNTLGEYNVFSSIDAEDITHQYSLKTGETPFYFGLSSIQRNDGTKEPNNSIRVVFEYFSHGPGDYLSVNSSPNIAYTNLPPISRDSLDFRPVQASDGSFTGGITESVEYGSDITIDYSYYLPRQDILTVTESGDIVVLNGTSGYELIAPKSDDNTMSIASALVPPGNIDITSGVVKTTLLGNIRYTMKDIGTLEQRVSNLEYYTQLTLLEKDTLDQSVIDQNGLERFKAGIQVDQFKDFGNSDTSNDDYLVSIDREKQECRAYADSKQVSMNEFYTIDSQRVTNNYALTGSTITLPYTNTVCISQPNANVHKFVNPFNVLTYKVAAELHPNNDTWIDTTRLPTNFQTIDNYTSQYNSLSSRGVFGTVWNDWNVDYSIVNTTNDFGSDRFRTTHSGSFTSSGLTGITNNIPVFQAGRAPNDANNWLVQASYQLYRDNGLLNPNGTPKTGNQLNINGNGQWGDNSSTYQFYFSATQTGTETYGRSVTTTNDLGDRVVDQRTLGYTRTRPILFKINQCKPNDTFTSISFGIEKLPTSSAGDIEMCMSIRINGTANTNIKTFFDNNAISESTLNDERIYRTVDVSSLSKYTDIPTLSEIVWDKGSLIYANGSMSNTAIVADVIQFSGYYELKCVNVRGSWVNTQQVYLNGQSTALGAMSNIVNVAIVNNVPTDANGNAYGLFYPQCSAAKKYPAGTNTLLFENSTNPLDVTSSAGANYYASGQSQTVQNTVLNTINLELGTRTVQGGTINFNQTVGYHEPIAQTFMLNGQTFGVGRYITQLGLYFSHVDSANPIRVQIAETLNGYPTQKVIAEETITSAMIGVRYDSVTPTEYVMTFRNPVFLQSNVEYCIIMISPTSIVWKVWANTGAQPSNGIGVDSVGSFFESQNASTWTAVQDTDLTFKMYCARFNITKAADVSYINKALNRTTLQPNSLYTIVGQSLVRVTQPNHGFIDGDKVYIGGIKSGPFASTVPAGDISFSFTVSEVEYDNYIIDMAEYDVSALADWTGYFGSTKTNNVWSNIVADEQIQFSSVMPSIDIRSFSSTDYTIGLTPTSYIETPSKEYNQDSEVITINNTTIELEKPMIVATTQNETTYLAGNKSFKLRVTLTSNNQWLSPALRVDRTFLVLIRNKLNNPSHANLNDSAFDQIELKSGSWTFDYNETDPENSTITINSTDYDADIFKQITAGKYITITA